MPKWGLTAEMRKERPYGLARSLLAPAKTITDPVHGDVRLTELERLIVDSPPFQRLRRIKQLGTTHLVYPGATHTRFSHSLGAVVAAQMLLDIVIEQRDEPNAKPDLFVEWRREAESQGPSYLKRVAEVTVLTRLGTLLHDLCHVSFGHSVEDELRLLTPHDKNRTRFEDLWREVDDTAREAVENGFSVGGRSLKDDVMPLVLSALYRPEVSEEGDDPGVAESTYPFAQDIVGNTISADLIDYLTRDHRFTGLPVALGHRFLDSLYVTPSNDPFKPQRLVLRVVRKQRERKDTLTELLKYLRYRYELSERALAHHAKLAADAMVGKLLQMYSDALYVDELEQIAQDNAAFARDLKQVGTADLDELRARARRRLSRTALEELTTRSGGRLEQALLDHGDDGLLEYVYAEGQARDADSRWVGVRELAGGLLHRQLFKPLARMSDRSHARRLWEAYGKDPDKRRQIEQTAAKFAGIHPAWHAVIWIPPERMRLKPALVLVDDDELIDTMLNRELSPRGDDRGSEIYKAHRELWGLEIFVHPQVRDDEVRCDALLAAFAEQLHISTWDRREAPVHPADVARRAAGEALGLTGRQERELAELVPSFYDGSVGLAERPTLSEMVDEYRLAWEGREVEDEEGEPPVNKDVSTGDLGADHPDPAAPLDREASEPSEEQQELS